MTARGFDPEVTVLIQTARQQPYLTPEDEFALGKELKVGGAKARRARDLLITSHLRLSVSIACRKARRHRNVSLADLIQEGNLGLFRAADKFDVDRGYRFATYAWRWVQTSIDEYLVSQGCDIRLPISTFNKVKKLNAIIAKLSEDGHVPTEEEVARAMATDVETVRTLAVYGRRPVSLNLPIGEDGTSELGDFIEDESSPDPEADVIEGNMRDKVHAALDCLNDRERAVIVGRFDLDGEGVKTLEDLGQIYDVTRERIRQIEVRAKQKLAKSGVLKGLDLDSLVA